MKQITLAQKGPFRIYLIDNQTVRVIAYGGLIVAIHKSKFNVLAKTFADANKALKKIDEEQTK